MNHECESEMLVRISADATPIAATARTLADGMSRFSAKMRLIAAAASEASEELRLLAKTLEAAAEKVDPSSIQVQEALPHQVMTDLATAAAEHGGEVSDRA